MADDTTEAVARRALDAVRAAQGGTPGQTATQPAQAGQAAERLTPEMVQTCPTCGVSETFDCNGALAAEQKKAADAAQGNDPIARNAKITQAYKDLAAKDPNDR